MYNSNQLCIEFEQRQSVTSRELNLPFQMHSFLYHRVYASSLGYKYKCLILHNDEFGETWRHFTYAGTFFVCLHAFRNWAYFRGAGATTV